MVDHRPLADVSYKTQVTLKRSPSASYVYPVKSLLAGQIQPAEDQTSQLSDDVSGTQLPYDKALLTKACPLVSTHESLPYNELDTSFRSSESDRDTHNYMRQHSTHHYELSPVANGSLERKISSRSYHSNRNLSPNLCHYSAEDHDTSPVPPRRLSNHSRSSFTLVPHSTELPFHHEETHSSNFEAIEPSNSGFLEISTEKVSPLNPTDFVCLPPVPIPLSVNTSLPHSPSLLPTSNEASSSSGSVKNSEYIGGGATSELEEHVSSRFEHREDGNGNHVIVCRDDVLQRCEDEPICTPGSVQAFGVLIAVQDLEDTLIVRQVSENSTVLLGLSPRYLFSLNCFTDTLPDTQARLLWENIPDPHDSKGESDNGPQVFLLSGWGAPGTGSSGTISDRRSWTCWCAIHRPTLTNDPLSPMSDLIIMEFELEMDPFNPLYPSLQGEELSLSPGSSPFRSVDTRVITEDNALSEPNENGLEGDDAWFPPPEDIQESTTIHSQSIPALERLRKVTIAPASSPKRIRRPQQHHESTGSKQFSFGMMDMFAVLSQINEQLGAVNSLELFLKVVVGIIKDLTQFHRVMVYQFDESWNGQVVAELVDWTQTRDLYKGLHFPASDIPAQARALYVINKVRILYNRSQITARLVVKGKEDLHTPLNMSHCYLRAMSPIHIKYLANMGVRASMSISILAFGSLWGLITCHSYGPHGMRVSFPVRQMLRLLSQSISRNIERISYAQRLHARKLVNSMVSTRHSTGYIVSNTDDLLGLFDADSGILVIGGGAKIIGDSHQGQETLIMAEYLRLKKFNTMQVSQTVSQDFPDLKLTTGLQVIAGLLLVPLSSQGTDFIAFLRRGQLREVRWAGKPYKEGNEHGCSLEPRKSFKTWSEIVNGRSRPWTDEQLETAGVLALVYGKFIEVWRQKENALQTTRLTEILLSNASHEVRTPLNHIINYLEMALDGPLDSDARENLSRSYAASKSLLFTINDLLDLTRLESGRQTSSYEPFDLRETIDKATLLYRKEAKRRDLEFRLELEDSPSTVVGDATKIQTVVQNLTANALKYTPEGTIIVSCMVSDEAEDVRPLHQTVVDIAIADTGIGMSTEKLEGIFRDLEKVGTLEPKTSRNTGLGLGLAVVARIVEQLDGQLRVDSKAGVGSRFSFLIPLALPSDTVFPPLSSSPVGSGVSTIARFIHPRRRSNGNFDDVDSFVEAMVGSGRSAPFSQKRIENGESEPLIKAVKVDTFAAEVQTMARRCQAQLPIVPSPPREDTTDQHPYLRILIVEDNDVNRLILAKRLTLDHHTVVNTTNGQEGLDKIHSDREFDVVLMDLQMPILNGFEATQKIRELERTSPSPLVRPAHRLNGRIPIFAVSASLAEKQHNELVQVGMDGWILKPIDFRRLRAILKGVTDADQRTRDVYRAGYCWEEGGWLKK